MQYMYSHDYILGNLIANHKKVDLLPHHFPKNEYRVIYREMLELGEWDILDLLNNIHHTSYTLIYQLYRVRCHDVNINSYIKTIKAAYKKKKISQIMNRSHIMTGDELQRAILAI